MPEMRTIASCAALVALTVSSQSARAETIYARYLAGGNCYQRFYDPPHLRKHPQQTITKFHVKAAKPDPFKTEHPRRFTAHFGFWVKNKGAYTAQAVCKSDGSAADCAVEGDGGHFRISPDGDGLKVTLGNRLEVEGDKNFSPDIARGDNRVMLLPKAGKDQTCM